MAESVIPDGAVTQPPSMAADIVPESAAYQGANQTATSLNEASIANSALPSQSNMLKDNDVEMSDRTPDRVPSPAILPGTSNSAASPMPQRNGTPSRVNGNEIVSRATSQHPDPAPTIPKEAPPHGAPTRQYLNSKVTGVLLEGMKQLAKEQPPDPLRVLGEYLLQRSGELEGKVRHG